MRNFNVFTKLILEKLQSYSIIRNVRPSVRHSGGNGIFSAPIKDRQLKFLVKIPMTHLHLIYTLFVNWGARSIPTLFVFVIFSTAFQHRRLSFSGIK